MERGKKQRVPWNKGLTKETDERVRKYSETLTSDRRSEIVKKSHNDMSKEKKELRAKRISKSNKGKPKSETHKMNMSKASRGKKSKFWKGGVTTLNKTIRTSYKYRQWRSDVFTRDNFTCQNCGCHSGCGKTVFLEAHHIKPLSIIIQENNIKNIELAEKCEEMWNINNGITYCTECHIKNDKQRSRFKNEK